jgi:hypothetical protein
MYAYNYDTSQMVVGAPLTVTQGTMNGGAFTADSQKPQTGATDETGEAQFWANNVSASGSPYGNAVQVTFTDVDTGAAASTFFPILCGASEDAHVSYGSGPNNTDFSTYYKYTVSVDESTDTVSLID